MSEPVAWDGDGTPRSPRFDDVYRPAAGGLAQAHQVFLAGCGLPAAWAGQPQWRILETGFGLGLNFLATWHAWRADPRRPGLLHFASVEAWPVAASDLLRSAAAHPELRLLAEQLVSQWQGLTPGCHRLAFDDGRVLLTLCVGEALEMLRAQAFRADAVFLDGFDPERNPAMWRPEVLKQVARLCRRGTALATWTVAGAVRRELAALGFRLQKVPGLPPKRECLRARYDPGWQLRGPSAQEDARPDRCIVVGAGLAGAALAASLARRGWAVQVLDRADAPAAGASALPAGLMAPHQSPDDNLLSRLTRHGIRIALQECASRLQRGTDWEPCGALEHRGADARPLPDVPGLGAWSRPATPGERAHVDWPADSGAWWHALAAWVRPAALVRAWLAQPGVQFRGGCAVHALVEEGGSWRLLDAGGHELDRAGLVLVAAAHGSAPLLAGRIRTQPVRGQVSWGLHGTGDAAAFPPFAINGLGHFLPAVALPEGLAWLTGSTYGRGDSDAAPRGGDHALNLERLRQLAPAAAARLAPRFAAGPVQAWSEVRCSATDRRPLVGPLAPGLWTSTAMGSRGLSFAALGAELIAARLHGEPLPLEAALARALDVRRQG